MFSFLKGNSGVADFDHIVSKSTAMVGDARHSFDLASLALLTGADAATVADDVRQTDTRINLAEQELRSELVVHVSVQGSADIGSVLGFTLLLKKIERIGDQAKNILELAESGFSLADGAATNGLLDERTAISELFPLASTLLGDPDASDAAVEVFAADAEAIENELRERIAGYMISDAPGRDVVPQAFYARYLLRIVANLVGVVRRSTEPLAHIADDDGMYYLDD